MSDYDPTTDFSAKDALPTGDSEKVILGADVDDEFDAISSMSATKMNKISGGSANNIVTQNGSGDATDGTGYQISSQKFLAGGSSGWCAVGGIHIRTADYGGSDPAVSAADEFILEGTGNVGQLMVTSNTGKCYWFAGDPDDTNVGQMRYDHSTNQWEWVANGSLAFTIESNGTLHVETTNYENLVTNDDDIPNKKYVDDQVTTSTALAPAAADSSLSATNTTQSYTTADTIQITLTATSSKVLVTFTGYGGSQGAGPSTFRLTVDGTQLDTVTTPSSTQRDIQMCGISQALSAGTYDIDLDLKSDSGVSNAQIVRGILTAVAVSAS